MSTEKLNLEQLVRNEVKSLFDAKPDSDHLYHVYSTIDKAISAKFKISDTKENNTKIDILRIVEFFNTFHFFESINDFVRDAYVNSNHLRHGFLTNGVLLRTEKIGDQLKVETGYTIPELAKLYNEKPKAYKNILNEIKGELEGFIATDSGEKWYFWPGCEMKIPAKTDIVLDTSISKSKFVITEKNNTLGNKDQIVLQEKPYELEVSLLTDNEIFYENDNNKRLGSGLSVIKNSENGHTDFSKVELELKDDKEYDYTLYVPYNSPRSDVKTHMKIFSADATVEEFIATCT